MKAEDLKVFLPRKSGVVLIAEAKKKSSIILTDAIDTGVDTHVYTVLSKGPNVVDLEVGEQVYPMTAVLAKLDIEDADQNRVYYYCEESFIKLHKVVEA